MRVRRKASHPIKFSRSLCAVRAALWLAPFFCYVLSLRPLLLATDKTPDIMPLLWEGPAGITFRNQEAFLLPTRNGYASYRAPWTPTEDGLAYYSSSDNAVAIVSSDGTRQWVSLKGFLSSGATGANTWVENISSSRTEIFVNVLLNPRLPMGVIVMDRQSLKPRWADDFIAARGFHDSDVRVVVTRQGRLVLQEPHLLLRELLPTTYGITAWDYDPATDRFAYIKGDKTLHVVGPGGKWQWSRPAGMVYDMETVSLVRNGVLVVEQEFVDGYGIAAFSDRGRFEGWRYRNHYKLFYREPLREADEKIVSLLRRTAIKNP